MENQGKRVMLAVALCAGILLVATWLWGPKGTKTPPPAPPPATPTQPAPVATGPATPAPAASPAAAGTTPAAPATSAVDRCVEVEGDRVSWDTPGFVATFSRCGAAIQSWKLKGKQYRDKHGEPLDLVFTADDPALYPMQVQLAMPESGADPNAPRTVALGPAARWDLVARDDQKITFRWSAPARGVEVEKTFARMDSRYAIRASMTVKNVATTRILAEASFAVSGFQDPAAPTQGMFNYAEPHWEAACHVGGGVKTSSQSSVRGGAKVHAGDVRWAGMMHKFFLFVAAPLEKEQMTCAKTAGARAGVMETRVTFPAWTLEPGQSASRQLVVYAGPKLLGQLDALGKIDGRETLLGDSVALGWFAFLARPMLWLLQKFHAAFGNWGVAIILLTIVVKLVTLYWTHKSMKSMKAMSKLKPKIDELKQKYPNDKQRQNMEMMGLYKAHKVNPLGGCLPMLLQMPVWFALYAALGASAELYHAPFFGHIHDLTAPDPFYIIPVLLTALMFAQAKISPASLDSTQQKMMMYAMPIMFGGFSLFFPAGLTVYIFTNTLLSMAHQYYLNKTDAAATPAPVPAPAAAAPGEKRKGKKAS